MDEMERGVHEARLTRPWWATCLAALGSALVLAGMVSMAAVVFAGQAEDANPELALERLVEARAAAYLADARAAAYLADARDHIE